MEYENLLREISTEVPVIECDMSFTKDKGYFFNGVIFIDEHLSSNEKLAILLEEYSHFKTSVGIILDQSITDNRKQERRARNFAYEIALSLDDIVDCYKRGIIYYWECAEYLNFPEDFIFEAVKYLRSKLGEIIYYKNYVIKFVTETIMRVETQTS